MVQVGPSFRNMHCATCCTAVRQPSLLLLCRCCLLLRAERLEWRQLQLVRRPYAQRPEAHDQGQAQPDILQLHARRCVSHIVWPEVHDHNCRHGTQRHLEGCKPAQRAEAGRCVSDLEQALPYGAWCATTSLVPHIKDMPNTIRAVHQLQVSTSAYVCMSHASVLWLEMLQCFLNHSDTPLPYRHMTASPEPPSSKPLQPPPEASCPKQHSIPHKCQRIDGLGGNHEWNGARHQRQHRGIAGEGRGDGVPAETQQQRQQAPQQAGHAHAALHHLTGTNTNTMARHNWH